MLKFTEFPARLKEDIAASLSFKQALMRLTEGKDPTPRSWVYEDEDPKTVLSKWSKILADVCAKKDLDMIAEWDLDKSSKFASQGGVAPFDKRLETLSEYWTHLDSSPVFSSRKWKEAKKVASKLLGFNKSGRPLSVEAVINRGLKDDKYNTSSGDPLFLKRKNPAAIDQAREAAENGTYNQYYPTLGSRASMGKTGEAARWIFMFPMSVNLVEQTFMYPLMDYIRKRPPSDPRFKHFFAPWDGYDRVQDVLSTYGPKTSVFFGSDYTKMDQHFNLHHGLEVYDVIKDYFLPQYHTPLKASIEYTFTCPVISPKGLIPGPHAMPSGSGWTNFLESMFNFILWIYISLTTALDIIAVMAIGDDQLAMLSGNHKLIPLSKFIVNIFKSLGMDANYEKQEVSETMAAFLQRRSYAEWSPMGVNFAGVYPTVRALTSEIYPEFYHNEKLWSSKTFALRCLMIAENCVNHPAFEQFVLFIAAGNHNIVEFAKSDDKLVLQTWRDAKSIANFVPTYNQEKANVSPLKFRSLAIIRERF